MGCGASKPEVREATAAQARSRPAEPQVPCLGLLDTHELVKELGRGGTGETFLYKDKQNNNELVAVKLIRRPLPKVIQANILREIMIQANLGEGHVNVINAKEALLTESHLALVMEYAACGSLTGYVANRWQSAQHSGLFLQEDEARYFFRQFIQAVEYCHTHFVAHRDLKLDNTLLDLTKPPMLKLCDFGFAKTWESNEEANMYTHIGTPVYMSPELINSRNGAKGYDGKQVDVWASGVLLIVMLLGTFPFDHIENPDPNTSEAHLEVWMQQIRTPWTDIPHIRNAVEKLSPECTDLLNKIFVINEKERITIAQIKEHPWYNVPLVPKYAEAERDIEARQRRVEQYIRHRDLNIGLINTRNKRLEQLVNAAAGPAVQLPHSRRAPLERIDLREEACRADAATLSNGPTLDALPDISEDGAEGTDASHAAGQRHSEAVANGGQ
ncbi:kinase-like protein [Coccomyxa subellipsoidea C-169]|uniref:Kinase-like protein n=1 Tax=Coccomyxa subellipsoidea (strain C-169) TaxID=574566 RepID=I0Z501_COCSC|nr:kinase-like protein [Coccomyxa subellipsoidea C-169]EIE25720.1 kinase-like protein [Coccomyxa subellipsoidea C-169]|eukprot:XP_005650264.1 kinase-like protein [Coccomyxa subellipsoidea C-169]